MGTLRALIRAAGISVDEFLKLLQQTEVRLARDINSAPTYKCCSGAVAKPDLNRGHAVHAWGHCN